MTKAKFTRGDCDDEVIQFPDFDAEAFRDLYQRETVRYRYGANTEDGRKQGSWTDATPGAKERAPQIAGSLAKRLSAEAMDVDKGFGNINGVRLYREIIVDYDGEVGTLAVMRLPSYFTATLFFEDGRWSQIDKHVKTNSRSAFSASDDDDKFLDYVRYWICSGYFMPDFRFAREILAEAGKEQDEIREDFAARDIENMGERERIEWQAQGYECRMVTENPPSAADQLDAIREEAARLRKLH